MIYFVRDLGLQCCLRNICPVLNRETKENEKNNLLSFSKLKLLKIYLMSTMSQKMLNELATCSVEKDILVIIDLNIVLNDFASKNVRRSYCFERY
jgi:hypothetical protein